MVGPQTLQDVLAAPRQPVESNDHDKDAQHNSHRYGEDEQGDRLAPLQAEDQPGQSQ